MTLQEKELLARFLEQLAHAQPPRKDAEADALIRETAARQPDAAYLLVQRALQLEQLLQASQEQLRTLNAERGQTRPAAATFLSDPNAWGSRAIAGAAPQTPARAPALSPAAAPAQRGSWASGLFGNIASTAAGVVAGSFLFQGIRDFMNRGESDGTAAAAGDAPAEQAFQNEPELLNSFDTAESEYDDSFLADGGDSGDFA
jgi:hypothetical protein